MLRHHSVVVIRVHGCCGRWLCGKLSLLIELRSGRRVNGWGGVGGRGGSAYHVNIIITAVFRSQQLRSSCKPRITRVQGPTAVGVKGIWSVGVLERSVLSTATAGGR